MILQAIAEIDGTCLSNLALGGLFLLSVGVGFAAASYLCFKRNSNTNIDIQDNLITNGMAIDMIERFMNCYHDENNTDDCSDDTISGHFELDVLLTYIAQMKAKMTTPGKPMSGLEFYFAKYATDSSEDSKRNTIVIYPTYQDVDSEGKTVHIPCDPDSSSPVPVIRTTPAQRNVQTRNVLNKLNMSPPRQPTI